METALDDSIERVTATVDLLGRAVTYDAGGLTTTTTYDLLSRATTIAGPTGLREFTYNPATGRLATENLDGVTLATATYQPTSGRLASVTYGNGTTTVYGYDSFGQPDNITITGPGGTLAADEVDRSLAGRVTDQRLNAGMPDAIDLNTGGDAYTYDGAGRLTAAWDTPTGSADLHKYQSIGCPYPETGHNTNRSQIVRDGVVTNLCYDQADRLVSGTGLGTITYDDHGNTTAIGTDTYTWDAADRHTGIQFGANSATYVRDPLDRIVTRTTSLPSGSFTNRLRYTGHDDVADALVNAAGLPIERYLGLPGGATLTINTGGQTWVYANLHGDIMVTADATGTPTSPRHHYDPWGVGTTPDTSTTTLDHGYLGTHGRRTDQLPGATPLIDMGARPYHPALGRFLTTDPIEGGCANPYTYGYGDPINGADITGKWEAPWNWGDEIAGAADWVWDRTGGKVVSAANRAFRSACKNDYLRSLGDFLGFFGNSNIPSLENLGVKAGSKVVISGGARYANSLAHGDEFLKASTWTKAASRGWLVSTAVATLFNLGCKL